MQSPGLKLGFRQFQKNKTFSLLNLLGLTLGLTTFLLIVLYVADERSYDRYNTNADRIVRIHTDVCLHGQVTSFADASPAVGPKIAQTFPEVEKAIRVLPEDPHLFRRGSENIRESRLAFVDPGFFDVFTFHTIEGDPAQALNDPHSAIITASTATRWFNTTHAIGRTLTEAGDSTTYIVKAVIADMPAQSQFHYDILLSMMGNGMRKNHNFYAIYRMSTYVLLKNGADRAVFDAKLRELMRRYAPEYAGMEAENNGSYYVHLSEMPLTGIHLHSHRSDELETNGNSQYVNIFSAIAVLVLLIAGINFMNLATARSVNRAREIGVRKVLGSARNTLIAQFLGESVGLTLAATTLALLLTTLLLPWFNQLTGKQLSILTPMHSWLLPSLAAIVAIVGLGSGIWPAFFLSGFRPVEVLKGRFSRNIKTGNFRNTLVVVQFTISIFLIIGTLVVFRQLDYIRNKDLGFDRSQVLVVDNLDDIAGLPGAGAATPVLDYLKKEVRSWPGVADATLTSFLPTGQRRWHNWGMRKGDYNSLQTELWEVDEDYIPTMDMQLVKGRNFSKQFGTDTTAIILNETAARQFGILANPLGQTIQYSGYWRPTDFKVIGIIKDFNFNSLHDGVTPLVLVDRPDYAPNLAIRIQTGNIPAILQRLKAKWPALGTRRPFEYSFMDEDFDAIYHAEQRMGRVVVALTTLAILIACLGLFGLAAHAAEQRTKEIGIRKVLGANTTSIVALLSKDFARLIAIAIGIAAPLSWFTTHRWLQDFAYRTTIGPWPFVLAAASIVILALITTLFQSLKAAVTNPVETLRSD